MVKIVGGLVNHGGDYVRIFLSEETGEIMFDNEPMGYCVIDFGRGTVPKFDPISLPSAAHVEEEGRLVNLCRMYTPTYRGIIKLQNEEYLLIKEYSPLEADLLSESGIRPSEFESITHEIDEDDEEGLDLAYLVVTLKEAGY